MEPEHLVKVMMCCTILYFTHMVIVALNTATSYDLGTWSLFVIFLVASSVACSVVTALLLGAQLIATEL
ncbi:hypothetical protein BO71DRAFT_404095 [Aspergillus ellipticus CBS 707.79]|uniref:Uncharacterized protein n=1 Tax=Aspergillus ellipticus CBS 707.79 TaxID=1448320 RepID=A0A319DAN6_9EURO|nr:hypothetical protein BO71DRAFT_404095 [Aspergillus ellipticus CBS 707.79]